MQTTREHRATDFFSRVAPAIEQALDTVLPPETAIPARIHEAMRYSVFAGGKRLRPLLCIAGYATFRDDWESVLDPAAALELIHTYSLIHDDLPAMDDDDFRRGRPSCHRRFGEAVAILAGDALLTLAFATLARGAAFPPDRMLAVIRDLADAAGTPDGMIAGQVLDLEAAGRPVRPDALERIHRAKTGAMLEAAVRTGAFLAGAGERELAAVAAYGRDVGLAFQVVDDLLDETAPGAVLGKTPGKDRRQQKATYPGVYGPEDSRAIVQRLMDHARQALAPLGARAAVLLDVADYLESRSR